jgi:anti-anti-sigma factor
MSGKTHSEFACAAFGTDAASPPQPWESPTVRFTARWESSAAVVSAHGDIDASNAKQLAEYVQGCTAYSGSVILDLSGVEFFGTAGFSALHTINVRCAAGDVQWSVVPSKAVSRLLRICDPDHTLPIAQSVAAVRDEDRERAPLLQLVSQPR